VIEMSASNDQKARKKDGGVPLLGFIIIGLVIVGVVRGCLNVSDRKSIYRECEQRWLMVAPTTGILGYDSETGIPLNVKPKMPDSFKKKCKESIESNR
jgi:hypothetical protein